MLPPMKSLLLISSALLALIGTVHAALAGVQLVRKDSRFELQRNGAPYLVKGGGGGENALELPGQGRRQLDPAVGR